MTSILTARPFTHNRLCSHGVNKADSALDGSAYSPGIIDTWSWLCAVELSWARQGVQQHPWLLPLDVSSAHPLWKPELSLSITQDSLVDQVWRWIGNHWVRVEVLQGKWRRWATALLCRTSAFLAGTIGLWRDSHVRHQSYRRGSSALLCHIGFTEKPSFYFSHVRV